MRLTKGGANNFLERGFLLIRVGDFRRFRVIISLFGVITIRFGAITAEFGVITH